MGDSGSGAEETAREIEQATGEQDQSGKGQESEKMLKTRRQL